MIYYKVQIGSGRTKRFLGTHFKKKSTARVAAERFAHSRVVKRRAKHGSSR
jgi:hypothetical protein